MSKNNAQILLVLLLCLVIWLICGCETKELPLNAGVVAPVGQATAAAVVAVTTQQSAAAGQHVAEAAVLSKVSASAGAIREINAGQPPGARTDGVANEADIILALAGEPVSADKFAASERARIVAEGKADAIAKAYAAAQTDAQQLRAKADAAQAALEVATARLAAAQQAAAAEQAELQKKYQAALDKLAADGNARVAAAVKAGEDKARAEQNHWVTIIFFGLSAVCIAGGIVVLVTTTSIPMFGPKAGFALIGAGAGLAGLGIAITQLQNFLYNHPWVVGATVATCLVGIALAGGLMWANHHHVTQTAAPAVPAT